MDFERLSQWLEARGSSGDAGFRRSVTRSLSREEIRGIREKLERLLLENIIPFWYPRTLDLECGGYRINHGLSGQWRGSANKRLVAQARVLWFFSRLQGSAYAKPEFAEAARHGFEFLADKMWDQEFGGFYWEVNEAGDEAVLPQKHIYGQAFALYGISEYALSTGDEKGTKLAGQLFDLMEHHAHDESSGGYVESFGREWNPARFEQRDLAHLQRSAKTMNTHLHLLEATTRFLAISDDTVARKRVAELLFILSNSVLRKEVGVCTDLHEENWRPRLSPTANEVSYGHNLENIHLLLEAMRALELPQGPLLDLGRVLTEQSTRHGFDHKKGGFYSSGPLNRPASRREKIWWVEAESLLAMLEMFCLTGEEMFLGPFLKTLDWIVQYQADWERGEWYEFVTPGGEAGGVKAGPWKCPYHNGRAMIRGLELLDTCAGTIS